MGPQYYPKAPFLKEHKERRHSARLRLKKSEGWYRHEGIPYKIHYTLEMDSGEIGGEIFDERHPGRFALTSDMPYGAEKTPEHSLSIWVHKSVPVEYKDIVVFHELKEAELIFVEGLNKREAHKQAIVENEQYAKTHLSDAEFEKFLEWQKGLDNF